MAQLQDLIVSGATALAGEATVGAAPTANMQIANKAYVDGKITYGTGDLTPGSSSLATGTIYLMYE